MKYLMGILVFLFAAVSFAEVDPAVRAKLSAFGKADVLVRMKAEPNLSKARMILDRTARIQYVYDILTKTARRSQRSLLAKLKGRGISYQSFHIVNAVAINNASPLLLNIVAAHPEVKDIILNVQVTRKPEPVDLRIPRLQLGRLPSNLEDMNVEKVWTELGARGKGIVLAGQDSGFAWLHPALKSQYRGFGNGFINHNYNWHDAIHKPLKAVTAELLCRNDSPEPCDDSGHGTHTLGSMLGDDGQGNQIGVAPEAKWIGCKNMDRGTGNAATYLECFEFLFTPYPQGGNPKTDGRADLAPHIINNSWACPASEGCRGDEFVSAVKAMKAAGIMVVAAIGNEGPGCGTAMDAPGSYHGELLSVGAYSHYDKAVSSFSSRGPSKWNGGIGPDIVAPGSAIRSSVPSGGLGDGLYDYKSGTSMAAPHAAGVVALLWSAKPNLIGRIDETIALMKKTAKGMTGQTCGSFKGSEIPNAVAGHGLIDAYQLIKSAP